VVINFGFGFLVIDEHKCLSRKMNCLSKIFVLRRLYALNVDVFTRGIQSFNGDDKVGVGIVRTSCVMG
jgi:hypothetical protein